MKVIFWHYEFIKFTFTSTKGGTMSGKGTNKTVEPIRDEKDIKRIKDVTFKSPRDHLLLVMGINNGLRVSDLLSLKVEGVKDLKPGQTLRITEKKTGKANVLMVNKAVHKALKRYLEKVEPDDEDYLFKSRKGNNGPLDKRSVHRLVNKWAADAGIKGHFGTHTLRKTFGYMHRVKCGTGFEILAKRYNHSSPATTMRYLGITDSEVNGILMNEI